MTDLFAHLDENILKKTDIHATQIFLSYARRDNRQPPDYTVLRTDDPITALRAKLARMGFPIWLDTHDIYGGEGWWEQIQTAIEKSDALVVCLSANWLASPVARQERLYALQLGKPVLPILIDDLPADAPDWVADDHYYNVAPDYIYHPTQWDNLVRVLANPQARTKVVFMPEKLPTDFVKRPHELNPLVTALLGKSQNVGITTAFKGAGGFGKTTLACALCHEPLIREQFRGGIVWIQLKEDISESEIIAQAQNVIRQLGADVPNMSNLNDIHKALQATIGDKRILVVVDDVWSRAAALPFYDLGPKSATLFTTRNSAVLPQDTQPQTVDTMRPDEAQQMLVYALKQDEATLKVCAPDLKALSQRLGNWALVLKLANKQLFSLINMHWPLQEALEMLNEALGADGFTALDDPETSQARYRAVTACLAVTLKNLSADERQRFAQLAIFPEDTTIPLTMLGKVWGLNTLRVIQMVKRLDEVSLLLQADLSSKSIRLHDVIRQYLRDAHHAELHTWQTEFVQSWGDLTQLNSDYEWRNLAYHLLEAGQASTLSHLLTDFEFLQAKLNATDVNALMADCDALSVGTMHASSENKTITLLRSALSLSIHVLDNYHDQLPYQLTGRLWTYRDQSDIALLWQSAHAHTPLELLATQAYPPMLQVGGALIRTLEHTNSASGALQLTSGDILSWGQDKTLRLWSVDGTAQAVLKGHTDDVDGALQLRSGDILSWSDDKTLRLWGVDGTAQAVLAGHTGRVSGALQLTSGDILSWSEKERTLRLWGVDGTAKAVLVGHTDDVRGALQLTSGDILSWSKDKTLRLWGVDGTANTVLAGHTDDVRGALQLTSGDILSWGQDKTLRLWGVDGTAKAVLVGHTSDVDGALQLMSGDILSWSHATLHLWGVDGTAQAVLQGHTSYVRGALQLTSGDILSWCDDQTLRLWGVDGTAQAVLQGHTGDVWGALQLTSGDILSWGINNTLRLWGVGGTAQATLEWHTEAVRGALQLTSGHILSWAAEFESKDNMCLWSVDGTTQAVLQGHTDGVMGALQLTSGDILSWAGDYDHSEDYTLRLWGGDGTAQAVLEGHIYGVSGALQLTSGNILSWGGDKTLRVWGVDGTAQAVLQGHTSGVRGALQLISGDILSWSWDHTLRLWGMGGTAQAVLQGHTREVEGALQLRSGDILSWSRDKTLRVWSVDGTAQAVLKGHTGRVSGALQLRSGDILSWSGHDKTLRLWGVDGTAQAVLSGHTSAVWGALQLRSGDILSWSGHDQTLRLWGVDGTAKAVLDEDYRQGNRERIFAWARTHGIDVRELYADSLIPASPYHLTYKGKQMLVYDAQTGKTRHIFVGDADIKQQVVLGDGTIVLGDSAGRVLFLQLRA